MPVDSYPMRSAQQRYEAIACRYPRHPRTLYAAHGQRGNEFSPQTLHDQAVTQLFFARSRPTLMKWRDKQASKIASPANGGAIKGTTSMVLESSRATRWRPGVLVAFIAALGFTLVMALMPHPPQPLGSMGDKYQHMLAFATLAALAAYGFPAARLALIGERLSFLGALIEVAQALPVVHRDCDLFDWLADTSAVVVTLGIIYLVAHQPWVGADLSD